MNGLAGLSGSTFERGNREKFVCEAEQAINFQFAERYEDLQREDENKIFKPEFTHQVR